MCSKFRCVTATFQNKKGSPRDVPASPRDVPTEAPVVANKETKEPKETKRGEFIAFLTIFHFQFAVFTTENR